jgi:hypothetical protein
VLKAEPAAARPALLAAAAGLDYPPGRLAICQARALGGLLRSDLDAARSGAAAGLSLARAADDMYGLEMILLNLGAAALLGGDLNQAGPLLAEALDIADRIDDRVAQFYVLGALGCHAAFSARPGYAARLLGAADTAATEVGASVMPFLLPVLARAGQVAEAALGTARFQAERTAGEDLSRRAALELALGRSQRDHQADAAATERAGGSVQPLSNREADVARLLADGLTNRQNKLGFASRAQVAAWITSPD